MIETCKEYVNFTRLQVASKKLTAEKAAKIIVAWFRGRFKGVLRRFHRFAGVSGRFEARIHMK